jgi:hypothetical protein
MSLINFFNHTDVLHLKILTALRKDNFKKFYVEDTNLPGQKRPFCRCLNAIGHTLNILSGSSDLLDLSIGYNLLVRLLLYHWRPSPETPPPPTPSGERRLERGGGVPQWTVMSTTICNSAIIHKKKR